MPKIQQSNKPQNSEFHDLLVKRLVKQRSANISKIKEDNMSRFKPRTKQQNKVFHTLLSQYKFDDEAKKELVFDVTGGRTESSAEMSYQEMNYAIKHRLHGTPVVSRQTQRTRKNAEVVTIVSPTHIDHLNKLWRVNPARTAAGLEQLCLRIIKVKKPRTSAECNKVVEAVKSMNKRYIAEPKEAA